VVTELAMRTAIVNVMLGGEVLDAISVLLNTFHEENAMFAVLFITACHPRAATNTASAFAARGDILKRAR